MTHPQFKKEAKKAGLEIYKVRKTGETEYSTFWDVTYASILSNNAVSTQSTHTFEAKNLKELAVEMFNYGNC